MIPSFASTVSKHLLPRLGWRSTSTFRRLSPPKPAATISNAQSSSLYVRIQYAGGLRRLVDKLYPRVLADPSLTVYFKHLDDEHLKGLRWHMLTLLAVVTGGPSKYQGRDLHQAHAELQITGEAFDRVAGHLRHTLEDLEVRDEDQQAILAAVQARRQEIVTFEA